MLGSLVLLHGLASALALLVLLAIRLAPSPLSLHGSHPLLLQLSIQGQLVADWAL